MPPSEVAPMLEGVFERLRREGASYQFTYGPNSPVSRPILDRLGLKAARVGGTLANVPLGSVYRIRHRPSRASALYGQTSNEAPASYAADMFQPVALAGGKSHGTL